MYTVQEVLGNIDANPVWVSIMAAFGMLVGYVQCIESVRLGFRDKTHAMPIAAVAYFLAHDSLYWTTYLAGNGVAQVSNHWFFAYGAYILAPYNILELILAWQIITYSRQEIGLGKTWLQAFLAYVAIQVAMYVVLLWTRSTMDDSLYLVTTLSSLFVSQAFMIPMMLRRQSRKGQSILLASWLCFGFGIAHFFYYPLLAAYFRTPIVLLAGAVSTTVAAVYLWMVIKAPPYVAKDVA